METRNLHVSAHLFHSDCTPFFFTQDPGHNFHYFNFLILYIWNFNFNFPLLPIYLYIYIYTYLYISVYNCLCVLVLESCYYTYYPVVIIPIVHSYYPVTTMLPVIFLETYWTYFGSSSTNNDFCTVAHSALQPPTHYLELYSHKYFANRPKWQGVHCYKEFVS